MSRLEELIHELCPDGVTFFSIRDVCKVIPAKIKIKSNDYMEFGKYPVIDQGQNFIGGYTDEEGAFEKATYVIFGDHTCSVKYVDFSFVQGADGVKVLKANENVIIPRFLYHCMTNIPIVVNYARHWSKIKKELIPVPPLPVQSEIVRILDNFTELTARKKQYRYYRDEMFKFNDSIQKIPLNNVVEISRGVRVVKKQLTAHGIYPVYQNCLTPMGYYDKYNCQANTTYIISAGAAGEIGYSNIDFWAADDCLVFTNPKCVINKYIFYFLQTKQDIIYSNVRRASIPRLSKTVIEKLVIPLPSLEEQEHIVNLLDRFDILCNDISNGLPAEIAARQKQYEYYRDKLLTFKERS